MSLYRILTTLIIIALLSVSSCTKTAEGTIGPAGAAGQDGLSVSDQRSGIYGYVHLVNQYTVTDTTLDGVTVSTAMGDSVLSTSTDNTGKFFLPGLKSGTYRIMFKKNNYDSFGTNVIHTGGNVDQFTNIIQLDGTQTTQLTSQTVQLFLSPFDNVTKYVDMETSISGPPISGAERYMNVYFSSSRNLNAQNNMYGFNTYTHGEPGNQFETQIFFAGTDINSTHFQPGDTVFMKSYIVPPYSMGTSWFDTNDYQTVTYPYVGDSLLNYFIWTN
jgi:hypothetical protein